MTQLVREEWWPTPVWYYDIPTADIDVNIIEKECYALRDRSEGRIASNSGGWQGIADKDCVNTVRLLNYILPITISAAEDYGVKHIHKNIPIENSWININYPNSHNVSHVHAGSILSGVIYIKSSKDSGDFVIESDQFHDYFNCQNLNNSNRLNFYNINYEPIVSRLIIFPSWMKHRVDTNRSNEDRISISFNI